MKAWFGLSGQPLLWLVIVTTALVLFLLVRRFERYMVFHPSVYPAGFWRADAFGIAPEDCTFRTSDELTLHGWFIRNDQAIATFLWCHGNAGNLSDRLDNLARLAQLPFNIFIFDYRGYGKSEGTPSEEGLYLDAEAAYHFLLDEKAISPDKLILFGRSLGGAVAIDLATKHAVAGVIVESTFTTISDMARHLFPYLPTVVLKTKFESQSKVSRITHRFSFCTGAMTRRCLPSSGATYSRRPRTRRNSMRLPGPATMIPMSLEVTATFNASFGLRQITANNLCAHLGTSARLPECGSAQDFCRKTSLFALLPYFVLDFQAGALYLFQVIILRRSRVFA